jgi:hypothetical protein
MPQAELSEAFARLSGGARKSQSSAITRKFMST